MMTVISPHLDDAVLSLGQYLATGPGPVEVVTCFAGIPGPDVLTDYDRARGFTSSAQAMQARDVEDANALRLLGVDRIRHLDLLDGQYGEHSRRDVWKLTQAIFGLYSTEELMFAPVGIGHPDHRLVASCARSAVARHAGGEPVGLLLYEELPYRVLHPEEVSAALYGGDIHDEGWVMDTLPWPLEQGDRADRFTKAAAIGEYRSQFPAGADDPCLLVPERVWRITQ